MHLNFFYYSLILTFTNLGKCQYNSGRWDVNLVSRSSICKFPSTLQGEWFSREDGKNVYTFIDYDSIKLQGEHADCLDYTKYNNDNFTYILRVGGCYYCIQFLIRTLNVLEKVKTTCITYSRNDQVDFKTICTNLESSIQKNTLFSTNPSGKNCRSSLEGVWRFGYQNTFKFTGECTHPEANITACQKPGTQFFNVNQQFLMSYKHCDGMRDTQDAFVQYKCLGDWYVGKNHYFAVVNIRESRIEEKYRCMIRNRDDDLYIGISNTAECKTLHSPRSSPERLRLYPVKAEVVQPLCKLYHNFTGVWVNTANFDAEVTINSTHIVERWNPDSGRTKREIYVCKEQRDTRFVMARLGINGCQKDYVCFDFVPRHHNAIRYRRGQAMSTEKFSTVCAWTMFEGKEEWKYDIMIAKNPVAIKCPVAGKFRFHQIGEIPFETRIRGGVTKRPRPTVYCKKNISDFSVCDTDQKIIEIDADKCISSDYRGRPDDIYSEPDYKLNCIGYWKENLKSYLITHDDSDAYSKYRCWVYQRDGLNKILMSMSIGAFCHVKQTVHSNNSYEGAQVALSMIEYEREHDDCAMFFDDGANPYRIVADRATVLRPSSASIIFNHHSNLIYITLTLFLINCFLY